MIIYYTNQFGNKKGESHRWLAKAISMHTGQDATELVNNMHIGELGKPSIDGIDEFSISHSNNMWAVLFDTFPCGLDIQHHKAVDYMKLANRWYNDEEKKYLGTLSGEELVTGFYKCWTRREALVKSVGGSIVDSNLPSTIGDCIEYMGQKWKFQDFTITGADNMSIAFCVKEVDEMNIVWLGECDA